MLPEAEFAAVVERVMADEGWVCVPEDHEDIPEPGECINCDAERHRFGYRLHQALTSVTPPACACGRVWEGHPNPHAITCPMHVTAPGCQS